MAPPTKARRTKSNTTKPSSKEDDSNDNAIAAIPRRARPAKRSAGRKSLKSGPMSDDTVTDSDLDTYVDDDNDYLRLASKRKRSSLTPCAPPHLIDMNNNFVPKCNLIEQTSNQYSSPVTFTVNVPLGHEGPFVVSLDIKSLLSQVPSQTDNLPICNSAPVYSYPDSGYSSTSSVTSEVSKPESVSKRSFLDLPAEIRNQIYRLAFVSEDKLDFAYPNNFSRSSALLRTCRQVHEEGRSILYSENVFYFQRRKKERAVRWTINSYEIGYKDIRFFLKSIGLANVSLLRRLIIMFEDAQPSMNPHLKDADDRRFTCDDDLLDVLHMLADHTMLKTLDLCFQGRRTFYLRDEPRFVDYLTRIKADKVRCINNPDTPFSNWKGHCKILSAEADQLIQKMTRQVTIFR